MDVEILRLWSLNPSFLDILFGYIELCWHFLCRWRNDFVVVIVSLVFLLSFSFIASINRRKIKSDSFAFKTTLCYIIILRLEAHSDRYCVLFMKWMRAHCIIHKFICVKKATYAFWAFQSSRNRIKQQQQQIKPPKQNDRKNERAYICSTHFEYTHHISSTLLFLLLRFFVVAVVYCKPMELHMLAPIQLKIDIANKPNQKNVTAIAFSVSNEPRGVSFSRSVSMLVHVSRPDNALPKTKLCYAQIYIYNFFSLWILFVCFVCDHVSVFHVVFLSLSKMPLYIFAYMYINCVLTTSNMLVFDCIVVFWANVNE